MKTGYFAAASLVLMIGCGSGGDDNWLTKDELNLITESLLSAGAAENTTAYTTVSSGEVVYEGGAFLRWEGPGVERQQVLGAVELTANFADNIISGEINRIVSDFGDASSRYSGVLVISDLTVVDEATYMIGPPTDSSAPSPRNLTGGTLTGTIVAPDGRTSVFDATVEADVRGVDGQYMIGVFEGDVTVDGMASSLLDSLFGASSDPSTLP